MSDKSDISKIIQQLESNPEAASAVARLLQPKPSTSKVESYQVKVRHTISCKLCSNVYVESYSALYKQHMAKGSDTAKVEHVHYEHETQTCHDCRERLSEMPRIEVIVRAIERIRILSRGGD